MCTGATEKQRSDVKHIRYSHFVLTEGLLPLLWGKLMWQWWGAGQGSSGTLQADGAGRAGTHAFAHTKKCHQSPCCSWAGCTCLLSAYAKTFALFFLFSSYLCQRERNLLCTAVVQPLTSAESWALGPGAQLQLCWPWWGLSTDRGHAGQAQQNSHVLLPAVPSCSSAAGQEVAAIHSPKSRWTDRWAWTDPQPQVIGSPSASKWHLSQLATWSCTYGCHQDCDATADRAAHCDWCFVWPWAASTRVNTGAGAQLQPHTTASMRAASGQPAHWDQSAQNPKHRQPPRKVTSEPLLSALKLLIF